MKTLPPLSRVSILIVGLSKSTKMEILPGKFICGTNLQFQSRVILIPWVKKNFIRCCSTNSSFPVRYVPKNIRKTNELKTSPPPIEGFEGKKTNPRSRRLEDKVTRTHVDQSARRETPRSSEDKTYRLPNPNSSRGEVSDVGRSFRGDISKDMFEMRDQESLKTNELQTSRPSIEGFEGKKSNPRSRRLEDEEMCIYVDQSARLPPPRSSEDKMNRLPNPTSSRVEFRGDISEDMSEMLDQKSLKTNELQTSSLPIEEFEGKKMNPHSMRLEDEETRTHVDQSGRILPPRSSEDKIQRLPNPNSSEVEVSDFGRSFRGGDISKDVSRMQDQKQVSNNYSTSHSKSEMVEENYHKRGVGYEFMKEPTEAVEELEFEVGQTRQEVEKMAVQILGTRAFTAVKLKKKLLAKRCPLDIVNAVIADFRSRGFINDSLYAESYSRSRWSSGTWGPRRIKKGLSEKGVNKADAEEAVKLVFEDGEAGDDQVSSLGFSKLSMDRLLAQASKQWLRSQDVEVDKQKARMIRWLQYRGFDWAVVSYVLKKLQSQNPP